MKWTSATVLFTFSMIVFLGSGTSAANRYSAASGNWNSTSTWSTTETGGGGATVPTSVDTVIISQGNTVTVNVANAVCVKMQLGSPTGGNGAGTIAFNASSQLTVSGAVTLGNTGSTTRFGTITMTAGGTLVCTALVTNSTTDVWTPGAGTVQLTATNTLPAARITSFNNLTLSAGTTTLGGNEAVNGTLVQNGGNIAVGSNTLTINGSHDANTNTISGAGGYTLASGATLLSGHASGVGGNITTTTKTLNTGANYTFDGVAAQVTSATMPASVNNLTVSNAAGVTLSQNTTANGTLTLTNGILSTGANKVIVTSTAPAAVAITSGSINGEIQRSIAASSTGLYMFTDLNTQLTPNGSQGAITASIRSFPNSTPPNIGAGAAIKRYYTITPSAALTATVRLSYLDAEINSVPEASMSLFRYSGVAWAPAVSVPNQAGNYVEAPGVSSFSEWTIGDADHPLPIQLSSFTGTAVSNTSILLNWVTVSEVNNYGFYVERKRPNEQEFIQVTDGFVPGNGTTNEAHSYTLTDVVPGQGAWMYRLKQVDLNGTFNYVEPITVDVATSVTDPNAPIVFALQQNYPNPFNPATSIQYSVDKAEQVRLRVFDMLGREVATLVDEVKAPGVYSVLWDASKVSTGMYLYKLETATNSSIKRMILLK